MEAQAQTQDVNPYHISLDIFEGPLDLLLHLIKENQMDIYNIQISVITKQYLEYIEVMEELNLDIAGEFLVMAATLAHIKSKLLLPKEVHPQDENEEGEDPRDELVRRLLEYQKYKQASQDLYARPLLGRDVFTRTNKKSTIPAKDRELAEVSVFKLVEAFHRIVKDLHHQNVVHKVELEPIAVYECVENLRQKICASKEGSVKFRSIFEKETTRLRVVVTFLALLDMIKRGYIRIFQADTYSDIEIIGNAVLFGEWNYDGGDEYAGPAN